MPPNTAQVAATNSPTRSAVSNGSRTLFSDGRSVGARRFRDLVGAFSRDLGQPLSPIAEQIVRNLAQVSLELELMQAQRASGGEIEAGVYATLSNTQMRLLGRLERLRAGAQKPKAAGQSLQSYLASRNGKDTEAA